MASLQQGDAPKDHIRRLFRLQSSSMPITFVAGRSSGLARLFWQPKQEAKCADSWSPLAAVFYWRQADEPDEARLANLVSTPHVLFMEILCRPEGPIAIEDHRHGNLRLLADHGVFFEFIPREDLGKPSPARHSLAEVELGLPYAVAISSPAGIWACIGDEQICFDSREPPLLRRLMSPAATSSSLANAVHPFPMQAPHFGRQASEWLRRIPVLSGSARQ